MPSGRADLPDLSYFLAIARHLSFARAAVELRVTASALSHSMKGLEARLGVRLLHRTNRSVTLTAAGGPFDVEVVGIDSANLNMGMGVFLPRSTLAAASGLPADTAGELWISVEGTGSGPATPTDHDAIDRTALAVDDALASAGYALDVERTYVQQADEQEGLDAILAVQRLMGLLIVGVGMLGLVNTITMGVIERTRELGVLRCLGARRRDILLQFLSEAVMLSLAGGILGVALGSAISAGLEAAFPLPTRVTPGLVAAGLLIAVATGLLAGVFPARKAAQMPPIDALRYE